MCVCVCACDPHTTLPHPPLHLPAVHHPGLTVHICARAEGHLLKTLLHNNVQTAENPSSEVTFDRLSNALKNEIDPCDEQQCK